MTSTEAYRQITSVLAEIKGNTDKARVRELQREYAKLSRAYSKAIIAERSSVPMLAEFGK